jgi:SPP1 gp7 family putative phage head morphogenesis protein
MSDYGHKLTDKEIAALEKRLIKAYRDAWADMKAKIEEILSKMDLGKGMTPQELYAASQKYQRLDKLQKELASYIKDANADAVRMVNDSLLTTYKANFEWQADQIAGIEPLISKEAIKAVLSGEVNPFKKLAIDELKDRALIESDLTRQLMTGVISGDSIPSIAKRIQGVLQSNLDSSVRIARTETTRVEAAARFDVGKEAEKMGFKVYKRWVSTDDSRTRPSHRAANGQEVPLDEPFIVGGEKMMYPGDETASAANVINCRCTVVTISRLEKK